MQINKIILAGYAEGIKIFLALFETKIAKWGSGL
jgi:hypothetical protein